MRCFSCLGGGVSCFLVVVLWAESLKQKDTLMARNHKNNQPDDRGRRVAAARRQLRVGARQPGVSRTVEQSASGGVRVSCTALAATPHTAPPASIIPSVSTPRRLFSEIMIACITLGIVIALRCDAHCASSHCAAAPPRCHGRRPRRHSIITRARQPMKITYACYRRAACDPRGLVKKTPRVRRPGGGGQRLRCARCVAAGLEVNHRSVLAQNRVAGVDDPLLWLGAGTSEGERSEPNLKHAAIQHFPMAIAPVRG